MKVVIMAGGKGTRISSVASDIPKPMIKIEGKPVLEHELECLRDQGFTDIIITVSHLGNIIMDYFGDGSGTSPVTGKPFGIHIEYYFEKEPLGNAGALFKIKDNLTSDFLLLNADAVFDVDFNRFVGFHQEHGGMVTLFTHPNSHPYDSGLIIADKNGEVEKWLAKEDERPQYYRNRVNAGLHVISPKVLELVDIDADSIGKIGANGKPVKVDLDRQLLKPLAGTGILYWIMSEGTLLAFGKSVQPFMYRNWLVEGVGFYYMGKWIRKHECQRKTLSIGILIVGSIVTTAEYCICGRLEFYFGNLPMVYGMLALGKAVHIKDNILSMIGSKHSLHLYLYSPFVACVFSLLQMILFQTARHQEVITVVVVLGTTWLVMQGWFIRAIEKFKIA